MDAIIGFFSNILASLLPFLFKKKEPSEYDKQLEKLRFDIAAALTMYARCYHNPVDLAKQADHSLPPEYETASVELRKLGSTARALAATVSRKEKRLAKRKSELMTVSRHLIRLSNSMCTPYNCGSSYEDRKWVKSCEAEIRELLCIEVGVS